MNPLFFFIVGAQRSGTTHLYHLLDGHPQINMAKPIRPEPKFFIDTPKEMKPTDYIEKYHFESTQSTIACGEKSTSYYEQPEVVKAIAGFFPSAKIIFLLRNPIERAISNYYFSYQNGIETRTLEEVFIKKLPTPIADIDTSVSPFNYLNRGNYSNFLPAYIEQFGSDNVKIILFEDFIGNTTHTFHDVCRFLNVQPGLCDVSFEMKLADKNSSERLGSINGQVVKSLADYYRNEIKKLSKMTNLDLNCWAI